MCCRSVVEWRCPAAPLPSSPIVPSPHVIGRYGAAGIQSFTDSGSEPPLDLASPSRECFILACLSTMKLKTIQTRTVGVAVLLWLVRRKSDFVVLERQIERRPAGQLKEGFKGLVWD